MHLIFSEVMWFEEPGVDYNKQVNITIANISFKYNISMVDNTTLFLKFQFLENVEDKQALIYFNDDGYYFSSREGAMMESYKAIVELDDFIYYTDSGKIKYKGTWKDNQYHGWGCLYNHNVTKGEINPKNLTEEAVANTWI